MTQTSSALRIWAAATLAGYLVVLGLLPWWIPGDSTLPNSAAALGYNVPLAYLLFAGWTVGSLVLGAAVLPAAESIDGAPLQRGPGLALRLTEIGAVVLVVAALYWPPALARFGEHIESSYFLASMWRMACGDLPYADFEFVYSPLMIAPLQLWIAAQGFSMQGYYVVYALLQVALFALVALILQRHVPRAGWRYLAFAMLTPFLLDVLLGLNWIGWRYFAGILALFVIARGPASPGRAALAGLLLGLGGAYSYEYGVAGLAAVLAVQGVAFVGGDPDRRTTFLAAVLMGLVAGATWLGTVWWATDGAIGGFVQSLITVAGTAKAQGLGQFAFYWTGHALSLFVLLAAALASTGPILGAALRRRLRPQEYFLIGAIAFALVTMRVAMQRADYLHMAVPFVPLVFAALIGGGFARTLRPVALGAVALASVTQMLGHAPNGYWFLQSQMRGLLHEAAGRPVVGAFAARGYSIDSERSLPDLPAIALAARLADPDLAARPVLFYAGLWDMAMSVGVCPSGYAFYDILYSDRLRPHAVTADKPGLIVVITEADLEALHDGAAVEKPRVLSRLERLVRWTSSNQYHQSTLEQQYEYAMWKTALGDRLLSDFVVLDQVDGQVLLEARR